MGAAAYRRGSEVIAKQIQVEKPRFPAFMIMDRINSIPKDKDAVMPLKEHFLVQVDHNGRWWLMDADDPYEGFSLFFPSLEMLARRTHVYLMGYNETTNIWNAQVIGRG